MSSSQGTNRQTDVHTHGHRDSMTEPAQWADSVKSDQEEVSRKKFTGRKRCTEGGVQSEVLKKCCLGRFVLEDVSYDQSLGRRV